MDVRVGSRLYEGCGPSTAFQGSHSPGRRSESPAARASWRTPSDASGSNDSLQVNTAFRSPHPRIDSLGVTPGRTAVKVTPGSATEVPLIVPSWETLVERQCGSGGSIVGRVSDERDRPLPGARVTMLDESGAEGTPIEVIAESDGCLRSVRNCDPQYGDPVRTVWSGHIERPGGEIQGRGQRPCRPCLDPCTSGVSILLSIGSPPSGSGRRSPSARHSGPVRGCIG